MDVTDKESIQQAAREVEKDFGRLDVLINNAGIYIDKGEKLLSMPPENLEDTVITNVFGPYNVTYAFMPIMKKNKYGRIINISSDMGQLNKMAAYGASSYKLSKFALNGLTQLLSAEMTDDIKINAVCPDWTRTDMGGPSASRSPQQAARSVLTLAETGPDGPNGEFFQNGRPIRW